MPGMLPRQTEVGDLILTISGLLQPSYQPQIHFCLQIIVGQDRVLPPQWRPFLQFQRIAGNVRRMQRQNIFHALPPAFHTLPRQTIHQVYRQVFRTVLFDLRHSILGPGKIMQTPQRCQLHIIRRLYSHRNPVDSRRFQSAQQGFIHTFRIDLYGHFCTGQQVNTFPQRIQQCAQTLCTEHRRRAASDIQGIHRKFAFPAEKVADLLLQRR